MASKVKKLIVKPARYITKNVDTNEMGISINGRNAISQFAEKRK